MVIAAFEMLFLVTLVATLWIMLLSRGGVIGRHPDAIRSSDPHTHLCRRGVPPLVRRR